MNNKNKIKNWPLEAKAGLLLTLSAALIIGGTLIFGGKTPDNEYSGSNDINQNRIHKKPAEINLSIPEIDHLTGKERV